MQEQIDSCKRDGILVIKKVFSDKETCKLLQVAVADDAMKKNAMNLVDQSGKISKLSLWFTPGDDIYELLIRSERMV